MKPSIAWMTSSTSVACLDSCSSAFAADYDDTGTILWPAAQMLANHLAQNEHLMSSRSSAVELGSGIGLVGMLASRYCTTVLTDHNTHVLDILHRSGNSMSQHAG